VDGERQEFDQAGIGLGGQIEALRDGSGKTKSPRNHHLTSRAWKVKGNVVAEHTPVIGHGVPRGRDQFGLGGHDHIRDGRLGIGRRMKSCPTSRTLQIWHGVPELQGWA
jgi:hypothetical protein